MKSDENGGMKSDAIRSRPSSTEYRLSDLFLAKEKVMEKVDENRGSIAANTGSIGRIDERANTNRTLVIIALGGIIGLAFRVLGVF